MEFSADKTGGQWLGLRAKIPWSSVFWGLAVGALLLSICFIVWQRSEQRVPLYEGRIVDKWSGFSESETGSRAYYKLIVEDNKGGRTTVTVDGATYERAKIGMRIKNQGKGIELKDQASQNTFSFN